MEEALKVRSEGPDPQELGHPVPISFILMRSPLLVLGATRFVAYSNGFRFMMVVAFRDRADPVSPLESVHQEAIAALAGRGQFVSTDGFVLELDLPTVRGETTRAGALDRCVYRSFSWADGAADDAMSWIGCNPIASARARSVQL